MGRWPPDSPTNGERGVIGFPARSHPTGDSSPGAECRRARSSKTSTYSNRLARASPLVVSSSTRTDSSPGRGSVPRNRSTASPSLHQPGARSTGSWPASAARAPARPASGYDTRSATTGDIARPGERTEGSDSRLPRAGKRVGGGRPAGRPDTRDCGESSPSPLLSRPGRCRTGSGGRSRRAGPPAVPRPARPGSLNPPRAVPLPRRARPHPRRAGPVGRGVRARHHRRAPRGAHPIPEGP